MNLSVVYPPKVYKSLADRPRNVYLPTAINVVRNYTDPGDYMIGPLIVAFLAERKLPPNLAYDAKLLREMSEKYNVRIVNVFPVDASMSAVNELDKFLKGYVFTRFTPVWKSPVSDPHYGTIFVRNDVILNKYSHIIFEYDSEWEFHAWFLDTTSGGSEGRAIFCPKEFIGNNYIEREIWLPSGLYAVYTHTQGRGNTISLKIDDKEFILKVPLTGGWELVYFGTLNLNEGTHIFHLRVIEGEIGDVQDYLFLRRLD